MKLRAVPISLREANGLVCRWHRHHKPVRGYKFAVGCLADGLLVGAVIVGRPVARMVDEHTVAEVTRLVTDGTPNACSFLYGVAGRVAREMGYQAIQIYILEKESGTSLRAAGWHLNGQVKGRQWEHSSERQLRLDGHTRRTDQPTSNKQRWIKEFS